jgi:hypothetical protein
MPMPVRLANDFSDMSLAPFENGVCFQRIHSVFWRYRSRGSRCSGPAGSRRALNNRSEARSEHESAASKLGRDCCGREPKQDIRLVRSRARIGRAGPREATRLELIRAAANRPGDLLRLSTRGLGLQKRLCLPEIQFERDFEQSRELNLCADEGLVPAGCRAQELGSTGDRCSTDLPSALWDEGSHRDHDGAGKWPAQKILHQPRS